MTEMGWVWIDGHKFRAVRFTDTKIVHAYKSRRAERVSREIAKTFVKD